MTVMATQAIVIGFHHFHDLDHLALEGSFDRFRLTFTSRYAAHIRGVEIKMTGYAAVKATNKRHQVGRRCANTSLDVSLHINTTDTVDRPSCLMNRRVAQTMPLVSPRISSLLLRSRDLF